MAEETIIEEGEGMGIPNIEKEDDRLSLFEKLYEIVDNQYEGDCIGIVEQFVNLHLEEESYTSFDADVVELVRAADAILEVMNILSKIDLQ